MQENRIPKVCIGMFAHNEEQNIRATLDGLLAQDFKDFELIISDDESTDATERICREYATRDGRIRYVRQQPRLGIIGNANFVFEQCRSPYFAWAAGHDLFAPTFISKLLPVLESDPTVVCAYPLVPVVEVDGTKLLDQEQCRLDTRWQNVAARANLLLWGLRGSEPIYGLFRTDALRKTRLYRPLMCCDNLVLFEINLLGSIAFVADELYFLKVTKRLSHMRDKLANYRKTMYSGEGRKILGMRMTFWRLFFAHLGAIYRAPVPRRRKPILIASTIFYFLSKRGKHLFHDIVELFGIPRP